MDLKRYEKTRYQNIYRNKKNKNYMVLISNPKTSIGTINGKKITTIEEALKVRDNPKIKLQKKSEINYQSNFDELWEKYMYDCKYIKKLAYNTLTKKDKIYNKYFKAKFTKSISKIKKNDLIKFIDDTDTTTIQKNEMIRQLKAFYNWCLENEILLLNPMQNIKKYKETKPKMKYWNPEEIKQFFSYINSKDNELSYKIKILVLLGFSLGDRVGETRALKFKNIDTQNHKVYIKHSIDYDPNSKDFLSTTKTYHSQREIDISPLISEEIKKYKKYLINKGYNIDEETLIFLNHKTNKPYSDTNLRKQFYKHCEQAGVKKIRMYDLRHTYVATMMSEGKELYLISERLGHSSFSTTVNKYGHLSNKVRKEVALSTDKYL